MTKEITREQYLQLIGLLELAKQAKQRLDDVESSIKRLLDVRKVDEQSCGVGDPQHIGDALFQPYTADELLEKLCIPRPEVNS